MHLIYGDFDHKNHKIKMKNPKMLDFEFGRNRSMWPIPANQIDSNLGFYHLVMNPNTCTYPTMYNVYIRHFRVRTSFSAIFAQPKNHIFSKISISDMYISEILLRKKTCMPCLHRVLISSNLESNSLKYFKMKSSSFFSTSL